MVETMEYIKGDKDSESEIKNFIKKFVKLKPKEAREMRKKLEELDLLKLKEEHSVKIIDMMPENQEKNKTLKHFLTNWWVNFYHVLDPVSGALSNNLICPETQMPNNYHLRRIPRIPGLAHNAYWKDKTFLRYLLSRFFGIDRVNYQRNKPFKKFSLILIALMAYLTWLAIILCIIIGPLYILWD